VEEKVAFVFDTNFIVQVKKLDEVVANLEDRFSVYITQVSIDERISQVCREQKARFDKIEELKKEYADIASIDIKTTFEKRAKKYQSGMQANYEKLFGTNIIPFSINEETFADLLRRANQKQAPFCAEPGASDKGFKDSLLWMSILSFFKERGENKVIFVTNDNGFKKYASILIQEFFDVTSKTIEIKENNYYQELTEVKEETKEQKLPSTIPDIAKLREKIKSTIYNICYAECEDEYGNTWDERTFTLTECVDNFYLETVFGNLGQIISEHIFEDFISASAIFAQDDRIINGNVNIPISALENAFNLWSEIQNQYPDYIQPFYSAAASTINRGYRKPPSIDSGELPF